MWLLHLSLKSTSIIIQCIASITRSRIVAEAYSNWHSTLSRITEKFKSRQFFVAANSYGNNFYPDCRKFRIDTPSKFNLASKQR